MTLPPVPAAAKFVAPFIQRSIELEKIEPIVAYYCQYHAVQLILAQDLHLRDSTVSQFANSLLDGMEDYKGNAPEDQIAILGEEDVAEAYVEGFAAKVLAKAEADMDNHRVTRATSSTFYAASIFLDVLNVFPNIDKTDLKAKIRFAKFHAARIIKDVQAGRDPNMYDNGAEPQAQAQDEAKETTGSQKPEDSSFHSDTRSLTEEMSPSPQVNPESPSEEIPPLSSLSDAASPSKTSVLPQIPPSHSPFSSPMSSPSSAPRPSIPPSSFPPRRAPLTKDSVKELMSQAEMVSAAQKHAKYAVSALNYDDLETAKTELRKALALLEQNN